MVETNNEANKPILCFFDTCYLLHMQERAFTDRFAISSETLLELERIKVSAGKDEDVKYRARNVCRLLDLYTDTYTVVVYNNSIKDYIEQLGFPATSDMIIVATAALLKADNEVVFFTNDLMCRSIANGIFGLKAFKPVDNAEEEYKGYVEMSLEDTQMASLYSNMKENSLDLGVNEYAIITNTAGESVDVIRWDGQENRRIAIKSFRSRALGTIKPLDDVQRIAFDAISNMEVVALCGRPGSGKTTIPLAWAAQNLETQRIRRLHLIGHHEGLKGARNLGYMKGNRLEKQLTTGSLGNILDSKFGDRQAIEGMLASGIINIISTSDIRGVEFGSDEAILCTEAQDIDAYTIRTLLQRCKKGCKQIYEGDLRQIDISRASGFKKFVDVFRGNESFACVKLKNDYRNPLSVLADAIQ